MRISQIRAITNAEFVQMMGKCRPPTGWPSTIGLSPLPIIRTRPTFQQPTAVASSAGPDSTCLLFLLRRMIDNQPKNNALAGLDFPNTILSLHVNHDLQSDAEKMAYAAGTAAKRFKALHSELRIPWGEPPFPPRPRMGACPADASAGASADVGGDPIESVARTARYRLMFDAMTLQERRVHVLATGHHADDQIETVLMRLGSGSSVLGLGGMRPVRRFGMAMGKNQSDFGWFGHEGLDRWIVRPLLDVPKVRKKNSRAPPLSLFCRPVFFTSVFRTEFSRLASCIRFPMSSTAPISNRTSRCAMPFAICSLIMKRSATLLLYPSFVFVPLYDRN